MARLYLDENVDPDLGISLRQRGHDVTSVHELGRDGDADVEVLLFAISDNRAVTTHNRRHFKRLHQSFSAHHGIIICTFDPDTDALAQRIHEAILANEPLDGKLIRVTRPQSS